jgi:hypothetical protein
VPAVHRTGIGAYQSLSCLVASGAPGFRRVTSGPEQWFPIAAPRANKYGPQRHEHLSPRGDNGIDPHPKSAGDRCAFLPRAPCPQRLPLL